MDRKKNERMNGWLDERMDGQTGGQVGKRMDKHSSYFLEGIWVAALGSLKTYQEILRESCLSKVPGQLGGVEAGRPLFCQSLSTQVKPRISAIV